MAAQAIFTAKATQFFETTKKIREELKKLAKEATQIQVGATADKAAEASARRLKAEFAAQTAELKKKEAAAKAATAEIVRGAAQEAQANKVKESSARAATAEIVRGSKEAEAANKRILESQKKLDKANKDSENIKKQAAAEAAKYAEQVNREANAKIERDARSRNKALADDIQRRAKEKADYEKQFARIVADEEKRLAGVQKEQAAAAAKAKKDADRAAKESAREAAKVRAQYEREFTKLVQEEARRQAKAIADAAKANVAANKQAADEMSARNKALAADIEARAREQSKAQRDADRAARESAAATNKAQRDAANAARQTAAATAKAARDAVRAEREKEQATRAGTRAQEAAARAAEQAGIAARNASRVSGPGTRSRSPEARAAYQEAIAAARRAATAEAAAAREAQKAVAAAYAGNTKEAQKFAENARKYANEAAAAQREAARKSADVRIFDNEKLKKDASGFLATLQKAKDRFLATMLAFTTGYLVIQGLGKAFNAAKEAIIGFNSLMEKSQITLTTLMGGNAKAADRFLLKLKEFARLTPFEFKDLVPLTQRMLALGLVAQNEIERKAIPALRAMGNAAAALGAGPEGIERINYALGQMAQKGKASSEEVVKQLGNVGISGVKYLAQALNVTSSEVFDMMKKGMIKGKAAADAILYGMAHDPLFKDMMQRQSETFEGAMSNIKDAATMLVADGFKPLFKALSETAQKIAAVAGTKAFQKWAKDTMTTVVSAFRTIGATLAWMYAQFVDKLPYIIAILMYLTATRIINGLLALRVALMQAGTGAAMAWMRANVVLIATIAIIIAFIAAYRKFAVVREITSNTVIGALALLKGLGFAFAFVGGVIGSLIAKIGDLMGWAKRIPDSVTNALNFATPGGGTFIKWLGEASDSMKDFGHAAEGMEEGVVHIFDNMIQGWIDNGQEKFDKFMRQGVSGMFGFADMMKEATDEINKQVKKADDFSGLKLPTRKDLLGDADDEKSRKAAERAAKKLRQDQLQDAIKFYDAVAKAAEASAKRQMEAFMSIRDKFRELFGGAQDALLKQGIINNPLSGIIADFQKWVGLEPRMRQLATTTMAVVNAARRRQGIYQSVLDKSQGGDGAGVGYTNTGAAAPLPVAAGGSPSMPPMTAGSPSMPKSPGFPSDSAMKATGTAIGQMITQHVLAGVTTQRGISNCANVAHQIMQRIGIEIPKSNFAGVLAKNAEARGAKRIKVDAASEGDLLVYQGPQYGARQKNGRRTGYHVAVSDGQGGYVGNRGGSDYGISRGSAKGASYALDTSALIGKGVADASKFLPGKGRGSAALAFSGQGGDANSELAALFANLDGSLSKIRAVPKAWGEAVRDTEKTTSRFGAQTLLASAEFQEYLTLIAAQTTQKGQTVEQRLDQIVRKIRRTTNEVDKLINTRMADTAADQDVQAIAKANAMRGRESDPMAQLEYEVTKGKYQDAAPEKVAALWWQTRAKMVGDAAEKTKAYIQAEADRARVVQVASQFNEADSASLLKRARAAEITAKKLEILHTTEIQNLLKNGAKDEADLQVNAQLSTFTTGLDSTSAKAVTDAIDAQVASLKDRAAILQVQADLFKEGFPESYVQNFGEAAQQAYDTVVRLGGSTSEAFKIIQALAGGPDIEEGAKKTDKWTQAQRIFNAIINDKSLQQGFDKVKEYSAIVAATADATKLASQVQAIYLSGASGPEMERAIALAQKEVELRRQAKANGYDEDDIQNRLKDFGKNFDTDVQTKAIAEFSKLEQDAARGMEAWGDKMGLAALKFELARGSLSSLTEQQKAQMLQTQAGILGMEEFGQQYESLMQEQLDIAKEMDNMALARNGIVTARQRKELEFKYQDIEISRRLLEMTDKQREAYLRQRPAVEALREKVLELTQAQEEAQRFIDNTQELVGKFQDIFRSGLDSLYTEGFGGFFSRVAEGISTLIDDMSKQILAALFTKWIMGLFPQIAEIYDNSKQKVNELTSQTLASAAAAATAAAAYTAAAAAAVAFGLASAAFGKGFSPGGDGGGTNDDIAVSPPSGGGGDAIYAAIGIDRVPYNGMPVIAHQDEAILTAPEAEVWRGLKSGVVGPSIGGGARNGGASSVTQVSNSWHIGQINMPEGTNSENFADGLTEKTSRRSQREEMNGYLGK
jgi:tape measure domain-containing protein